MDLNHIMINYAFTRTNIGLSILYLNLNLNRTNKLLFWYLPLWNNSRETKSSCFAGMTNRRTNAIVRWRWGVPPKPLLPQEGRYNKARKELPDSHLYQRAHSLVPTVLKDVRSHPPEYLFYCDTPNSIAIDSLIVSRLINLPSFYTQHACIKITNSDRRKTDIR